MSSQNIYHIDVKELSKEEKERLIDEKIALMKKKNALLEQRHKEIEDDKVHASENSSNACVREVKSYVMTPTYERPNRLISPTYNERQDRIKSPTCQPVNNRLSLHERLGKKDCPPPDPIGLLYEPERHPYSENKNSKQAGWRSRNNSRGVNNFGECHNYQRNSVSESDNYRSNYHQERKNYRESDSYQGNKYKQNDSVESNHYNSQDIYSVEKDNYKEYRSPNASHTGHEGTFKESFQNSASNKQIKTDYYGGRIGMAYMDMDYNSWKNEQYRYDQQRIARSKKSDGNWKREWDNNKTGFPFEDFSSQNQEKKDKQVEMLCDAVESQNINEVCTTANPQKEHIVTQPSQTYVQCIVPDPKGEPVAPYSIEEYIVSDFIEESVTDFIQEPVVSDFKEESVTDFTEESVVSDFKEESVVSDFIEESVVSDFIEEPVSDFKEISAVSDYIEEPVVSDLKEEPVVLDLKDKPIAPDLKVETLVPGHGIRYVAEKSYVPDHELKIIGPEPLRSNTNSGQQQKEIDEEIHKMEVGFISQLIRMQTPGNVRIIYPYEVDDANSDSVNNDESEKQQLFAERLAIINEFNKHPRTKSVITLEDTLVDNPILTRQEKKEMAMKNNPLFKYLQTE